jgi:hypothetical protein
MERAVADCQVALVNLQRAPPAQGTRCPPSHAACSCCSCCSGCSGCSARGPSHAALAGAPAVRAFLKQTCDELLSTTQQDLDKLNKARCSPPPPTFTPAIRHWHQPRDPLPPPTSGKHEHLLPEAS